MKKDRRALSNKVYWNFYDIDCNDDSDFRHYNILNEKHCKYHLVHIIERTIGPPNTFRDYFITKEQIFSDISKL